MDGYFDKVSKIPLFEDIAHEHLEEILRCLSAKRVSYKKGEIIVQMRDKPDFIACLLDGTTRAIREEPDGRVSLIYYQSEPAIFNLMCIYARLDGSPITALAVTDCEILLLDPVKLITPCDLKCDLHMQIIRNFIYSFASKTHEAILLIGTLSKGSIRDKILRFLNEIGKGEMQFTIPYSREEMAHYLGITRTALSNELRRMRDDGVLRWRRNEFELL